MIQFDVIIATYERQDSLKKLLDTIYESTLLPKNIIVVDASKEAINLDSYDDRIIYIRSSHANQPYQRYVGYLASSSEFLVYFDDDMRVVDKTSFEVLFKSFKEDIAGIQPAVDYLHNFFSKTLPRSKTTKNQFFQKLKIFTGVPVLKDGAYWLCGLKGKKPSKRDFIEWFHGPVFIVRKDLIYKDFNFNLLNLYEEKLGKGEDSISGFTYAQQGHILYIPEVVFFHDPSYESTYTPDVETFARRYLFSRLYHSLEYARLKQKNKAFVIIHYHWYSMWRIIGLLVNQVINYKKSRTELIKGYIKGWFLTIQKFDKISKFEPNIYWLNEANNDITNK